MIIIQKILAKLIVYSCWHGFKQLIWHGLPNEPDLMRCKKCGKITKLDINIRDNL